MSRVLVVDDDEALRAFVRGVLTREGHQVLEAGSRAEGVRACRGEAPDLVLCDLPLNGGTGPRPCGTSSAWRRRRGWSR